LNEALDHQRPCPLCGAFERRVLFQRDQWHVVECARCRMVFIGNKPLAYDAQAAEHDWMDEYLKEVSRRKTNRPILMFFSRLTRPLRRDAMDRQLSHTLHWRREGKLLDLGCGDGRFLAMAAYVSETVFETDMTGSQIESAHQGTIVLSTRTLYSISPSQAVYNPAPRSG